MKKSKLSTFAVLAAIFALMYWLFLALLKIVGFVTMDTPSVLWSAFWIWLVQFAALWLLDFCWSLVVYIKLAHRIRKNNRRIIQQAKAVGVWDRIGALGGKALDLKAWEDFRIKRKAGESDVELRRRCMEARRQKDGTPKR